MWCSPPENRTTRDASGHLCACVPPMSALWQAAMTVPSTTALRRATPSQPTPIRAASCIWAASWAITPGPSARQRQHPPSPPAATMPVCDGRLHRRQQRPGEPELRHGQREVLQIRGGGVASSGFAGENIGSIRSSYCATALTSPGADTYGFAPATGSTSPAAAISAAVPIASWDRSICMITATSPAHGPSMSRD